MYNLFSVYGFSLIYPRMTQVIYSEGSSNLHISSNLHYFVLVCGSQAVILSVATILLMR